MNPCGEEIRKIQCSDWNGICDLNKRPISQRKCPPLKNGTQCRDWVVKPWQEVCKTTC